MDRVLELWKKLRVSGRGICEERASKAVGKWGLKTEGEAGLRVSEVESLSNASWWWENIGGLWERFLKFSRYNYKISRRNRCFHIVYNYY